MYRNFNGEKSNQHLLGELGEKLILAKLQELHPDKEWEPADNWYDSKKDILIRQKGGDYTVEVKCKVPYFKKGNALTFKQREFDKCLNCDELWFISVFPSKDAVIHRIYPKQKLPKIEFYTKNFRDGTKDMIAINPLQESVVQIAKISDADTLAALRGLVTSQYDLVKLGG